MASALAASFALVTAESTGAGALALGAASVGFFSSLQLHTKAAAPRAATMANVALILDLRGEGCRPSRPAQGVEA